MVNGINSQQMQGIQQFHRPDPSKIYDDLAQKVGAEENGITKDNLDNYLKKLQDEGKGDSKEAKFISKLVGDFDKLSGGGDRITADSMKKGMESMKPQRGAKGAPPDPSQMFNDLSKKVGAGDDGITKDDLESYLKKLQKNGGDNKETELVSKLLKDFDNISGGTDTITADSLQKTFQSRMQHSGFGREPQDPSTITSDQLQPPIDITV